MESAIEKAQRHQSRRFDLWLVAFESCAQAVALRGRLEEEPETRGIGLVAFVDAYDPVEVAGAMAAGVRAVLPTSTPPAKLDVALGGLLERQTNAAAYAAVRKERQAAALVEAKLRASEQSLARKLYSAIASLTGDIAPVHALHDAVAQFQRLYISRVLAESQGDVSAALKILAISRSSLYRYLKEYRLQHLVQRYGAEPEDGAV